MNDSIRTTYDAMLDDEMPSNSHVWLKRTAIALIVLLTLFAIGYGVKSSCQVVPCIKASHYD